MNPMLKKRFSIAALTVLFLSVAMGAVAPRSAHAQTANFDPVVGANTTIKNIFDAILKVYDFAKEHITDAAAVAYKNVLAGVLNTLAAETAKAIAAGDWNAPVFSFKKGFYQALADAAVGDLLSTFVESSIGIDLCNYQPDLTLNLILPLLKLNDVNYQYKPKCTLSGIAENLQRVDLKKSVKLNVSFQTYSIEDFASGFGRINNNFFTNTVFHKSYTLLADKYKSKDASPLMRDVSANVQGIVDYKKKAINKEAAVTAEEKAAQKLLEDPEQLKKTVLDFSCGFANDMQQINFAYLDSSAKQCVGTKYAESIDPDQFSSKWQNGAQQWVSDSTALSAIVKDMGNTGSSDFLISGMRRMEYPYTTCYNALNRALNVNVVNVEAITPDNPETPGKETGLIATSSGATRTFKIAAPNINNTGANIAYVTYTQGSSLTPKEFAACQIAFNSFQLMNYPEDKYKQAFGAILNSDKVAPGVRLADDTQIGEWAFMFNPQWVVDNAGGSANTYPQVIDRFIFETVYYQVSGDNKAAGRRKYVLDKINNVTAEILGTHETFNQMYSSLNRLFTPVPKSTQEELTIKEKLDDQQIALQNCAANELCAQKQLAEAAANARDRKLKAETDFAQEKGTLLNPETTAVSEQAKNVPEVHQNELEKAQGQAPSLGEYTGHIFADSAGLFLTVLFNGLLKNGYRSLNNRFLQPNGLSLPPDLQAQLDAKDESALAGFQESGDETMCTKQDLDIMQAWVNIRKSLNNIGKTGSGAITGLSKACKDEADANARAKNITPGTPEAMVDMILRINGSAEYRKNLTKAVAGGYQGLGIYKKFNNTLQDSAQSSVTSGPVKTILDNSRLTAVNFNVSGNFDLLNEMSICPQGQANPTIYQCTINPSLKDAIIQKMTIRDAISKGLLSDQAILGVDGNGQVPDTTTGFSLAGVQLLRKARVVPIGFEFATRLKIACYQKEKFQNRAELYLQQQPHAVYPWIANECDFKTGDEAKELEYRKLVLNATLKDILEGYSQTGTLNEVCGNFNVVTDPVTGKPRTTMSPFCGLINPDWVLSMPTPKCAIAPEYSDILEAEKGMNRLQYCTELQSETTPNNYGYCLKEENVWTIEGKSCPAEYSTCSTFVFQDGSIGNFNKDSLVGEGLCSAKNAGCTWVSTVKNSTDWQDTISNKTRETCELAGGTWDGVACSNSRLYLTSNVESCAPQQAGCSQVFGFKVPGNNLVMDGGFEYGVVGTAPSMWRAYPQTTVSSAQVDACLADGGSIASHCTVNYPVEKTTLCLSQGGTIQSDGSCSVVLNNAAPQQCGYCHYLGADPTLDRSSQAFNQNDCLNLNGAAAPSYEWRYGGQNSVYTQQCVAANPIVCDAGDASCLMMVAGRNDALTPGAEVSEGTRSMQVLLDSPAISDSAVIEYPLELSAAASSTIVLAGDSFTASFDLRTANISSNAVTEATLIKTFQGGRVDSKTITIPLSGADSFQRYSISLTALTDGTDLTLKFALPKVANTNGLTPTVFIDGVKIEYNSPAQVLNGIQLASSYSAYTSNTPFAVKLPPDYLKCQGYSSVTPAPVIATIRDANVCFNAGYFWDDINAYNSVPQCYRGAPDAPQCANFARVCRADEAGCQLFKPVSGGPAVPGVVGQDNYCPNECVGYFAYKQQATAFEPAPVAPLNYFIASTASQCTVESIGCDEFTNVSLSSAGTSPVEYYSGLKQCITPATGKGEAGYFIWQGSAGGPPQLRTFTLQAMGGTCIDPANNAPISRFADNPLDCKVNGFTFVYDGTGGPAVSAGGTCTNPDYHGSPEACAANGGSYIYDGGFCRESDLGVDLDCLKYFDKSGNFYFRRSSYVIEASAQCQILRKTTSSQSTCLATNGRWDGSACFYEALPSQSKQCSAEVNGCRAYTGSTGQNNFNVIFDNFEGTADTGWRYAGNNQQPLISSESITTLGHSLYVDSASNTTGSIAKQLSISRDKSYILTFWAKRNDPQPASIGAKFSTARAGKEFVTTASNRAVVDSTWKQFKFGPILVDWDPATTLLEFSNANDIYFDNITVQALQDTIYVVKDSWRTPASCDLTNLGLPMPQAQLGCQLYTNSNSQTVALKSFTKLCRESSVGCQLVFDTQNSRNPLSQTYNAGNSSIFDDLKVKQDELRAVVVDANSSCQLQFAGCEAVGYPANAATGAVSFLPDIYVINNVDKYEDPVDPILCKDQELGCKEVKDSKGNTQYLKIEINNTCSFLTQVNVPVVDSRNTLSTRSVNGWFRDGLEGVGCTASLDEQQNCVGGDKAWNGEFNQCTTTLPNLSFRECSGFTSEYKQSLANSCRSDYKGFWFDRSTSSTSGACGCARYPFDYYKASEYPEHNVAAAVCAPAYDQCTEFLDFNPNYIANGDFENINDLDNTPANWTLVNAPAGSLTLNYNQKSGGRAGLQLIKRTQRDLPRAEDVATSVQSLLATQSYVSQRLARLEKGKSYTVDFRFVADQGMIGAPGANDDASKTCNVPAAAVEVVPYYRAGVSNALPVNANDAVNKNQFKVFESTGQMKQATYSFLIPDEPAIVSTLNSDAACAQAGGFWDANQGLCFASDPNQPTTDYEVRIYGPLNGVCVNRQTGERVYLKGRFPLDKNLCEGLASTAGLSAQEISDYKTVLGLPQSAILSFVAPYTTAGSWEWQGNCQDSSYVIDDFQISLAADHQYYFIDDGTLNKGTCTEANWDQGCISFTNVLQNTQQILKVKPDRMCEEWLSCQERDPVSQRCISWQSCREQNGTECVRPGSTNDPLRYTSENGLLKNIDIDAYRKRLGISEEFRINRWRAGDYSGYTIPNLPPIEQMFDRVPGSTATALGTESLLPLLDSTQRLSADTYDDICRGYPEASSPFSLVLKKFVPGFESVNTIVKYVAGSDGITRLEQLSPFDRTSLCNYVKLTYQGRDLYITRDGEPEEIVVDQSNPDVFTDQCDTLGSGDCKSISTSDSSLNRKEFNGDIGVCIEPAIGIRVHGGVVDPLIDSATNKVIGNNIDNVNGPAACMTYYPL